jgi:hypothetical protein
MRRWVLLNAAGLALWLVLALGLHAAGLSRLTANLTAAAAVLVILAVVDRVLRRRSQKEPSCDVCSPPSP